MLYYTTMRGLGQIDLRLFEPKAPLARSFWDPDAVQLLGRFILEFFVIHTVVLF